MHSFSFLFCLPSKKILYFSPPSLDKKLQSPGCSIVNENTQLHSGGWPHSNAGLTGKTEEKNEGYELFI